LPPKFEIRKFDLRRILDEIERKLSDGALSVVSGQREPVREPIPPGIRARVDTVFQGGTPWSLHVELWRVIYVVEEVTVHILDVRRKGRLTLAEAFSEVE
jgi:hypothetical protein